MSNPTIPLRLSSPVANPLGVYAIRATYAWYDPASGAQSAQAPLIELDSAALGGLVYRVNVRIPLGLGAGYSDAFGQPGIVLWCAQQDTATSPWSAWNEIGRYGVDPSIGFAPGDWQLPGVQFQPFIGPIPQPDIIRLRHGTGPVCVDHDSRTATIYSESAAVLQTPFALLSDPPDTAVVKDPASGLPAFAPFPTPAVYGLAPVVPPVPVPTTISTCDPLRCGAASNVRDHLISLYVQWATVLEPAVHFAEVVGVTQAISALGELAVDSVVLGPFAAPIWAVIAPVMATLLTLAIPTPLPTITPTQSTLIWNGAYCQLTCNGDAVNPTSPQMQAWNNYLTAHSGSFTSPSLQLALLNALLDFTPLLDWQIATAAAIANGGCASFTCP